MPRCGNSNELAVTGTLTLRKSRTIHRALPFFLVNGNSGIRGKKQIPASAKITLPRPQISNGTVAHESLKDISAAHPMSCGCTLHAMPKFSNGDSGNLKSIFRSRFQPPPEIEKCSSRR